MTQPDQFMPEDAFNATSIAALAAMTTDDVNAELLLRTGAGHQAALDAFYASLPTGMSFSLALMTRLGRELIEDPNAIWATLDLLMADIKAQIDASQDQFALAIDELLGTGHTVQDYVDYLQETRDNSQSAVAFQQMVDDLLGGGSGNIFDDFQAWLQAVHDDSLEAQDKFAALLDGLLGTGHTIQDAVDWLQSLFDTAQAAPSRQELIEMYVGPDTTLSTADDLAQIVTDLKALLGNPNGLGTGYPNAGSIGGSDIITALSDLINGIVRGWSEGGKDAYTSADVANALQEIRVTIDYATAIAQATSLAQADAAVNIPNFHAIDPTLNASFNITTLTDTSPTTIAVTQRKSAVGFISIPTGTVKSSVAWLGYGVTNIDSIYVNLYSVNLTNGHWTPVWSSADVLGSVGSSLAWVYVTMPDLTVAQGECYAVEIQVVGSGTHTMVGMPNHWIPANPAVYPQQLAASRAAARPVFDNQSVINSHNATAGPPISGSGSFTATAGSTILVFVTTLGGFTSYTGYTRTVVYDPPGANISMQSLGAIDCNNSIIGFIEVFALERVSGGSKTIEWSVTGGGVAWQDYIVEAISYVNVGAVGALVTNYGAGTTLASGTLASSADETVVQSFMSMANSAAYDLTVTGGGTARLGPAHVFNSSTTWNLAVVYLEKAGVTSTSFAATQAAGNSWASAMVALHGYVPDAVSVTSPTYSGDVPWVALSSQTVGSRGTYSPERTTFLINDTYNYTPPEWANFVDWIAVGAGGSGEGEIGINMGQGGKPGEWHHETLTAGTDYIPDETVFVIVPGAGGDPIIGYFSDGNPGGDTVITWTDPSDVDRTITAAGGDGGGITGLFDYIGGGPGNDTFEGQIYYGGADTPPGCNGNPPGGAGGGAIIFQPFSGAGADGRAWAVARQS